MPSPPDSQAGKRNTAKRIRGSKATAPKGSQEAGAHKSPAAQSKTDQLTGSRVVISRRAAERVRAGHPWVYRSDIEQPVAPETPQRLIEVHDPRGSLLGTALYSSSSQIALRMVSSQRLDEPGWIALFRDRVRTALRERLHSRLAEGTDACRLIFSEADHLPGLIADKYNDLVVLQILTQGMDSPAIRAGFLDVLLAETAVKAVYERTDPRIQELEQLSAAPQEPLYRAESESAGADSGSTIFHLNGLAFHYDVNLGQKTGAFLDQRENYAAAVRHCRGEALDICTYQGGFALHLAQVCRSVTGVDASRAALEVAERNLELNRKTGKLKSSPEVEWIEANAFDLLRDWSLAGRKFDSIVLDPPAFAKSRRAAEGALRGYKELNLRALKMLRPGGTLITCSCSHHVGMEAFTQTVTEAAADAHRQLRLLERRGAAPDHPVILNIPETEYLKCLICRVD
jgi:23S rRNA (cytosine1962-C5)-methyltransferase